MRLRYAFFAAFVATTALVAVPALAEEAVPVEVEQHCVYFVVDQTADGELIMGGEECFATFAESALRARGANQLSADGAPQMFVNHGGVATASFTLGIHYDGYNGAGSSITVVGSSCSGGWWNTPAWFDNRTSSSYAGCYRLRHYDGPNLTGASHTTYGSGTIHNLTYFNNRTESVQYLS